MCVCVRACAWACRRQYVCVRESVGICVCAYAFKNESSDKYTAHEACGESLTVFNEGKASSSWKLPVCWKCDRCAGLHLLCSPV